MSAPVLCNRIFGGKKTFINIDTGQGKGKEGEEEANVADVAKLISMTSVPLEVRKEDFRPLQNIFCSVSGVLLFFARPLFLKLVPCAESPFIKRARRRAGTDTLSLSFEAPVYSISLGCLAVGNEKWQTNEKNEKEPLHSFIEKEEFRSKGKNSIFKESLLSPCTPRKWIRTIRGKIELRFAHFFMKTFLFLERRPRTEGEKRPPPTVLIHKKLFFAKSSSFLQILSCPKSFAHPFPLFQGEPPNYRTYSTYVQQQ